LVNKYDLLHYTSLDPNQYKNLLNLEFDSQKAIRQLYPKLTFSAKNPPKGRARIRARPGSKLLSVRQRKRRKYYFGTQLYIRQYLHCRD
jgi:hypothetical protein